MPQFATLPSQRLNVSATEPAPDTGLAVRIQPQRGTNWCWAAVAASISALYDKPPNAQPMTQCDVVRAVLANSPPVVTPCCGRDGAQPANCPGLQTTYNKQAPPDLGLTAIKHLQEPIQTINLPDDPPPALPTIHNQISQGQPVCIRFQFTDTGEGHVLVICDARMVGDQPTVWLADPEYADLQPYPQSVRLLRTNYRGRDGTWTHAYFTQ